MAEGDIEEKLEKITNKAIEGEIEKQVKKETEIRATNRQEYSGFPTKSDKLLMKIIVILALGVGAIGMLKDCNYNNNQRSYNYSNKIETTTEKPITKKIVENNLEEAITWRDVGRNLLHKGNFKEAIEAYDNALEINPNLENYKCQKTYSAAQKNIWAVCVEKAALNKKNKTGLQR